MKAIKNRLGKVLVVTTIAVSLLATSFAFADTKTAPKAVEGTTMSAKASSVISWSKAKSIFREELPSNAAIKYLHLTRDDGTRVYKGKAVKNSRVYSIEINAYTGNVREFESDYEGSRYSASRVGAVSKSTIISKIKDRVPGCYVIYVKLDRDDGRYVYEAEAYKNGWEYDFEFTKRGSLIESDRDKV